MIKKYIEDFDIIISVSLSKKRVYSLTYQKFKAIKIKFTISTYLNLLFIKQLLKIIQLQLSKKIIISLEVTKYQYNYHYYNILGLEESNIIMIVV